MKIRVDGLLVIVTRHNNRIEIECASESDALYLAYRLALSAANEGIE